MFGIVRAGFWCCWLRWAFIIGDDLSTYFRTNVAVRSCQVVDNPLLMASQKVDMVREFANAYRKIMSFLMVSLAIAEFAVYSRMLGPGKVALENLPKSTCHNPERRSCVPRSKTVLYFMIATYSLPGK